MLISKCVIVNTCSESLLNSADGMGLNFGIGGFLRKGEFLQKTLCFL